MGGPAVKAAANPPEHCSSPLIRAIAFHPIFSFDKLHSYLSHFSLTPYTMSNFQLPAGFRPAAQPGGAGPSNGGNGGQQSEEHRQAAEERQQQQQEMKRGMIAAMLEPAARERCECMKRI